MPAMADHERALTTTSVAQLPALPPPDRVVLAEALPDIEELFRFSRDAELRVSSLRMVVEERLISARGEEQLRHELWLRHPRQARVTSRRGGEGLSRDYEIWLLDDGIVTTYAPSRNVASRRPLPGHVTGIDAPHLPPFARQRPSLTPLPDGSPLETFIHPHGLFRNVLVTGPMAVTGTRLVAGREAVLVRTAHPRTAKVLVDRPDRSVEIGIDRLSGFLLLLEERIGETVTRRAEVTELVIDPVVPPTAFHLYLPADVRMLY
jgi:hypothetical protein